MKILGIFYLVFDTEIQSIGFFFPKEVIRVTYHDEACLRMFLIELLTIPQKLEIILRSNNMVFVR